MAPCRFVERGCSSPAVVRIILENGCVCFRDDREQYLCAHHYWKMTPLGDVEVVEELSG